MKKTEKGDICKESITLGEARVVNYKPERLLIHGGKRLSGVTHVKGAKNSVLPILAATVLCTEECVIHNCPRLSDVKTSVDILRYLGCKIHMEDDSIIVSSTNMVKYDVPNYLMCKMRSSIIFLGAILSRFGRAMLSLPGGCELGPRPIDLHLKALSDMGMTVTEERGNIYCSLEEERFVGANIVLSFPSVGATENIILAAVKAYGTTTIVNAAREPEICDLVDFLNKCGAKIEGAGESTIQINGVERLLGTEHKIIPDRIETTTFLAAAAMNLGNLAIDNVRVEHMRSVIPFFEGIGCNLRFYDNQKLKIKAPRKLKASNLILRTMPYPGFPTDAQSIIMAVACACPGTNVFIENIFESRYRHIDEFKRLGANICTEGRTAIVTGVKGLVGANVCAYDLRGAAALVVSGLSAKGETSICGLEYLDRGYERLEDRLQDIGAVIKRI